MMIVLRNVSIPGVESHCSDHDREPERESGGRFGLKKRRFPVLLSASNMIRSFWLALGFFLAASALAEDHAVQLLLPSRQLDPSSTFELRFASEMVPADQIGKPAPVSPLLFSPAVEGQFVWLSTRSGTFAPKGIL